MPYPCESAAQCVLDGQTGTCEPEGYCSLPDADCPSGRRYSEHAPAELSRACVGEASSGDSSDEGGPACEGPECGCARALVVAQDRSCAVTNAGRLLCWGDNAAATGRIVDPDAGADSMLPSPHPLGLPGVRHVALGSEHACAATLDGVRCWGSNARGQVSATPRSSMSAMVEGITTPTGFDSSEVDAVGVGLGWSCALVGGRAQLTCWGAPAGTSREGPAWIVSADAPVHGLAMARNSACARVGAEVHCAGVPPMQGGWELAAVLGAPDDEALAPVSGPAMVVGIAASPKHYCASSEDQAWCWGINGAGEVGTGTAETVGITALEIGATAMGLADDVTCGVVDGAVQCLGADPLDADAATSSVPRPLPTPGVEGAIVEVGVGHDHVCVRTDLDHVWCWGDGTHGQLGLGDFESALQPQRVALECAG
ncbi:MAG: hypothetical protein KDK70_35320 [Myxococcales bacterium]|nr:hypothetical protein [Myxococcales bacterium]